jgi:phage I-like protein
MKIKKRQDTSPKEGADKYGDVKFADPTNKKYPIDTEEHIRSAWNYINQSDNAGKYGSSEVAQIKRRIISAWKDTIDPKGPSSAAQSANAAYAFGFSGDAVPTEIMYMPAGKSTILPTVNGEPKQITVEVDASTAEVLQDNLEDLLAENVRPFIDFDHGLDGRTAAAAIPKQFKWIEGKGVYLELEWTRGGQQAVEGKDYSYFSPSFLVSEDGKPLGLPDTGAIGALTNNPAFREIQRIAASRSSGTSAEPNDDKTIVMSAKIKQALVDHGLLNAEDLDKGDDEIVPRLKKKLKSMTDESDSAKAKAAKADEEAQEAKSALAEVQKTSAETVVNAAVDEGKIAPKDEETKAFYIKSFLSDPKGTAKVISSLQVNPALKRVVAVDGRDRGTTTSVDSTGSPDFDLMKKQRAVLAQTRQANPKLDTDEIFVIASGAHPGLFTKDN